MVLARVSGKRSIGAAVAHFLDMEGVTGSIPVSTTTDLGVRLGSFSLLGCAPYGLVRAGFPQVCRLHT
jgi:hypothetical protein